MFINRELFLIKFCIAIENISMGVFCGKSGAINGGHQELCRRRGPSVQQTAPWTTISIFVDIFSWLQF